MKQRTAVTEASPVSTLVGHDSDAVNFLAKLFDRQSGKGPRRGPRNFQPSCPPLCLFRFFESFPNYLCRVLG